MPQIFDNIEVELLDGLRQVLPSARCCSFCVGYLNLRGWGRIADLIDSLPGGREDRACRVLVGMHRPPEEEMKLLNYLRETDVPDGPALASFKERITDGFRKQLAFGVPTAEAEQTLRQLARQLRERKVFVKAFLAHPLHAKLYLIQRDDPVTPWIGYVGSSNLTLAGLCNQGELNVEVVDQDAAHKLLQWFDERWNHQLAFDLTDELAQLIEDSWARTELVRPYLVYLKIAYHLSQEARKGEVEFRVPRIFAQKGTPLLDFQERAVSLAAYHLHRRRGVLLGDVVGLGKTLMAVAIARVFQEDENSRTLVICPPKLEPMWTEYLERYEIHGRVLSLGKVIGFLDMPEAPRYQLLIIDESHNLRNPEGRRYKAIREYIERNDPRVLLLTATPYNKHFTDLSGQLRLFVDEDRDLLIRPERFFQKWAEEGKNEHDFIAQFQVSPGSLRAFEKSPYPEDWRDLMRLFLVRRTRQFIIKHYAKYDPARQRYYVSLNHSRAYFPVRQPRTLTFNISDNDPRDQYARLFHDSVVSVIENLALPRYGLANYLVPNADQRAARDEQRILENLNRAGKRLIGFCRTNLFKRLESSGHSFLLSVQRHIVRNSVFLHALENRLPIPIGTQDVAALDTAISDTDDDAADDNGSDPVTQTTGAGPVAPSPTNPADLQTFAANLYEAYRDRFQDRFQWLDARFFRPELAEDLNADNRALLQILQMAWPWNPGADEKLRTLHRLLTQQHPADKVLVFTEFADTAAYLGEQLAKLGLRDFAVITSGTADPVTLARRFSPSTNGGLKAGESELRVLIATDVLAEGQNLQDAHIVVNYDLPWAIIRLIQRAGRVDRIGQKHDTILAYSFLPAEGVERIIHLRTRLFRRLQENQEVIGTDETFFGEDAVKKLRDLYTEKAGTLDDDSADEDIDLASLALQVWESASGEDQKAARALPPVVYATRRLPESPEPAHSPPGVITYLRLPKVGDALVRVDNQGNLVSQSLSAIFRAAACAPDTPALPRAHNHHDLVRQCVQIVAREQTGQGGQLGSLRSVRRKLYERLDRYRQNLEQAPLLSTAGQRQQLKHVLDLIWRYPLKRAAQDAINRQIRLGITDEALAELVIRRAADDDLCEVTDADPQAAPAEPEIICSLGLLPPESASSENSEP